MYKISIIIAMYNTKKYIEDTIKSIVNQSFEYIEIIIVDDGSTDRSVSIVKDLQKQNHNIRLYIQKNQGPAIARNLGMTKANGKYIMFLDSDDLLAKNALRNLYHAIEKHNSDVVIGSYRSFNENNKKGWYHNFAKPFVGMEFYNKSLDDRPKLITSLPVWNKIYLKCFLEHNDIHFYEHVHLREDAYFMAKVFASTEKISHIPYDVCLYRVREHNDVSLTHSINPNVFNDIVFISKKIDSILSKKTLVNREEIERERYITELIAINFRLNTFISEESSGFNGVLQILSEYLQKIEDDVISSFSFKNSIVFFLLKNNERYLAREVIISGITHALFNNNAFKTNKTITNLFLRLQHNEIERLKHLNSQPLPLKIQVKKLIPQILKKVKEKLKAFLHRIYFYLIGKIASFKSKKSDIWLIGECLGTTAQDTGYHFFIYCRAQHPEKKIYFVTKRENITPELFKIGNIIEYGTIRHHIFLSASKVHIYNNSYRDICEQWQSIRKTNRVKVVCFLQHGVIGLTKMHGYYDYKNMKKRAEKVDIFVTSSEYEKNIVVESLGHNNKNVFITGLSRYDKLQKSCQIKNKKIVYIPTWRNWLKYGTDTEFLESEYYNKTLDAINSILALQKKHSFEFKVCFHHAISKFTHFYPTGHEIDFVDMSTINVQEMIIDSGLLITDYSSISFDFAYCDKPVIFYQFDRKKFLQVRHGSFIDYKTELFGPVVDDRDKLLEAIKTYLKNDFQVFDQDREKAKRYFSYHDSNNSERIFLAIEQKLHNVIN